MKRLYIGCGPSPLHPQHLAILGDPEEWTFIDMYVQEPHIKKWDGRFLNEVKDESVEHIYSSHTLEHFEHEQIPTILETWKRKLKPGGKLTLNVPNLLWVLKRLNALEQDGFLDGYYNTFSGEHGLLSVIYGSQSHEGEYHKGAFTPQYMERLLTGFKYVEIETMEDAHDMGVIIAICQK